MFPDDSSSTLRERKKERREEMSGAKGNELNKRSSVEGKKKQKEGI